MIEPGTIHTPAVEKTLGNIEAELRALPPEGLEQYGSLLREFTQRAYEREKNGSPPEVVARAVFHALTSGRPHARYAVGKDSTLLLILARFLPDRLLDSIRRRLFGMPKKFGSLSTIQARVRKKGQEARMSSVAEAVGPGHRLKRAA